MPPIAAWRAARTIPYVNYANLRKANRVYPCAYGIRRLPRARFLINEPFGVHGGLAVDARGREQKIPTET